MNRFCGLPKGSSMLPRLAATVCITTTGRIALPSPARPRTRMVNGTKVISATSLVMNMEQKNGRRTRIRQRDLRLRLPARRRAATAPKRWHSLMPATTAMKQNRMQSMRTSM